MLTNWLLIVWFLIWLPFVAGLYLWLQRRRQTGHRPDRRAEVPVEVLSTEEELRRALPRQTRK
jgi:uncharacterized iron-regulated membrane protein